MENSDTKARYNRMDELFLNLASSIGILFSLIQAAVAGVNSVVLFSPLLLLGWALPIYVGYIRGAIRDFKQERVRGWIYLVVGVLIYCAHVGLDLLHVGGGGSELELFNIAFPAIVVFLEAMIVVAYAQPLAGWILGISKEEVEPDMLMISRTTQCSAFFLSLGLEYVVRQYVSQSIGFASVGVYLTAAVMICGGLVAYKVSESWSVVSRHTGVLVAEKRKAGLSSRLGSMLIIMLAGGIALGIGIPLSQSYGVVSDFLFGIGIFLVLSPGVIGWLSPPFIVRIDSSTVNAKSQRDREEIKTAVRWIETIERIRKTLRLVRE